MTDSEKLDVLNERLRRIERNSHIHLAIVVIGFLGIVSVTSLIKRAKGIVK